MNRFVRIPLAVTLCWCVIYLAGCIETSISPKSITPTTDRKAFVKAEAFTDKYKDPNYFWVFWQDTTYGFFSLVEFRDAVLKRGWVPVALKQETGYPALCGLSYVTYKGDLIVLFCATDSDYNKFVLARFNKSNLLEVWRLSLPEWAKNAEVEGNHVVVIGITSELRINLETGRITSKMLVSTTPQK